MTQADGQEGEPSDMGGRQDFNEDQRLYSEAQAAEEDEGRRIGSILNLLRQRRVPGVSIQNKLLLGLEVLIIIIWALFVSKPYLDMNPNVVPIGREYLSAIQMNHVWDNARECGSCALWYGNVRGGFPATVDPTSSVLHPLIIGTTLAWGVINGSKMALVGIIIIAGVGQWWLGYILGLRRSVRLWTAALAVIAGHVASRMNLGAFSLVMSTGSAVLVFPAMVYLARTRSRKAVIVLAAILAIVAVGGTGYIQMGLVFTLPAAVLLVPWERETFVFFMRRCAQALGLAVLFAAPLLVPFIHFLPQFAKDFDLTFASAQPLGYVPLNFVIRDIDFFLADVLGKPPWPAQYANFVGWVPVILAVWGLFGGRNKDEWRSTIFLGVATFLALWTASAVPLEALIKVVKVDSIARLLSGIRYTSFISSLAVPPLLGLTALGLDKMLDQISRRIRLSLESKTESSVQFRLDPRWLLIIPLVIALKQAKDFNSQWIGTHKIEPYINQVIEELKTPNLQWVNVPFGEHFFVEPAVAGGLKMSVDYFRTWHWDGKPLPPALLEANRHGPPEGMTELKVVDAFHIHTAQSNAEYASIQHPDGSTTICAATGTGGDIDVACDAAQDGQLIVTENNWTGWRAEIDGESVELSEGTWLTVNALAGAHTYSFRYRPGDVTVGFLLLLVGIVISGWWIWRRDKLHE
jgi:hypothetical protein